ncbi:OmpH family outer membrane protein [Halomonas binhaiensis]|nr:OmpH family outer membrane protein [Halomonas binhaiensis]
MHLLRSFPHPAMWPALLLAGLLAGWAPAAAATEVAVLDWRKALLDCNDARQEMSQLRTRVADKQQEAQQLGTALERLSARLESDTTSDAETHALMQEFQQKGQRFDQLRQEILVARQAAEERFLARLEPKMDQAVNRVIARHDVDILVDPNGVLHSTRDLPDLTEEVTALLNTL